MPSPKFVERIHIASDGFGHERIEEIEYRNDTDVERATVSVLALLIDDHHWDLRITDASTVVVKTVHPYGRPAYVRAFVGTTPTDHLLELPRY